MSRLKLITVLVLVYLILGISLATRAEGHKLCKDDPALVLIELSNKLKKEATRTYLRLDWNGTSVTAEQYDKLMETNKDHYTEDPNLRRP